MRLASHVLFSTALVLSTVLFAAPVRGQQRDQLFTATQQQLDVTKVLLAQQNAWNKGDLDAYLSRYKDAPETEAMLSGPVRGLQNIRAAFHANFPSKDAMGELDQSEVAVRALGDNYAIATGKYHLARSKKYGGDTQGTFSNVFEKTPKGWVIIFSVTT